MWLVVATEWLLHFSWNCKHEQKLSPLFFLAMQCGFETNTLANCSVQDTTFNILSCFIISVLFLSFAQGESSYISLDVTSCHPGYKRGRGGLCECDTDNSDILRCESNGRYLFVRVSVSCSTTHTCVYSTYTGG